MNRVTSASMGFWRLGLAPLLIAACSASDGEPGSPAGDDGSICPSCSPWIGGETSDFETDIDECSRRYLIAEEVTDGQARERGFDIDALRERLTREFSESFRWTGPVDPENWWGKTPSGYSESTTIRGSTEVVGMLHRQLDPQACADGICPSSEKWPEELECPSNRYDMLRFNVRVTLETDDGAIAVEAVANSYVTREDLAGSDGEVPLLSAQFATDLSQLQGSLLLDSNREGPQVGELSASLYFHPSDLRGSLKPWIHAPDRPEERDETVGYWDYLPLSGQWADDACPAEALPIDEETAAGSQAISLLNGHYPTLQAAVGEAALLPAQWANGEATSTSLEIGEPKPLCIWNSEVIFTAPARWRSSDGIVDLATTVEGSLYIDATSSTPIVNLSWSEYVEADDSFWGTSIAPLKLQGGTWARVEVNANYRLAESGVTAQGYLRVSTIVGCDLYAPCEDSKTESFPSPLYCLDWADPQSGTVAPLGCNDALAP